jgi:hypothetical protein
MIVSWSLVLPRAGKKYEYKKKIKKKTNNLKIGSEEKDTYIIRDRKRRKKKNNISSFIEAEICEQKLYSMYNMLDYLIK